MLIRLFKKLIRKFRKPRGPGITPKEMHAMFVDAYLRDTTIESRFTEMRAREGRLWEMLEKENQSLREENEKLKEELKNIKPRGTHPGYHIGFAVDRKARCMYCNAVFKDLPEDHGECAKWPLEQSVVLTKEQWQTIVWHMRAVKAEQLIKSAGVPHNNVQWDALQLKAKEELQEWLASIGVKV